MPLKQMLHVAARTLAPGMYRRLADRRREQHSARVLKRMSNIEGQFLQRFDRTVRAGPFAGMKYISQSTCSVLIPKLLGTYEHELHADVHAMIQAGYDVIIDVGCAEGFYAVGFSRACPGSRVIAYDIEPSARELCLQLATLNHVDSRLQVRGECTHATLAHDLAGRSLVICDCEGFEDVLLDPDKCPSLRSADILVELHDFIVPGITDAIVNRFRGSHDVRIISAAPVRPEDFPEISFLSPSDRVDAISEFRPPGMKWAVLRSKTSAPRPPSHP